jgi:pre-mRNA-processing factor 40
MVCQLHESAVKKQTDEKRRTERKQRHLQDDLRYALKKFPEPLDINMSYEEVRRQSKHANCANS